MTTTQFQVLTNIYQDVLRRQDWFNQDWIKTVNTMSLGELMTEVLRLPEGDNVITMSYYVVGINR